jgi:hypothetical protein
MRVVGHILSARFNRENLIAVRSPASEAQFANLWLRKLGGGTCIGGSLLSSFPYLGSSRTLARCFGPTSECSYARPELRAVASTTLGKRSVFGAGQVHRPQVVSNRWRWSVMALSVMTGNVANLFPHGPSGPQEEIDRY